MSIKKGVICVFFWIINLINYKLFLMIFNVSLLVIKCVDFCFFFEWVKILVKVL